MLYVIKDVIKEVSVSVLVSMFVRTIKNHIRPLEHSIDLYYMAVELEAEENELPCFWALTFIMLVLWLHVSSCLAI